MSKIGNYRLEVQETEDYRFGWESADRGEPYPNWEPSTATEREALKAQLLGWNDCHHQAQMDQPHDR